MNGPPVHDSVRVIGVVRTTFPDARSAPRQSMLAPLAVATVEVAEPYRGALADLSGFSHVWVLTLLDRPSDPAEDPTRTTPVTRRDGTTVGVFATRSPIRPSVIGMTLARLSEIEPERGLLEVEGIDLADGTPVLDLKPYVPAFDRPTLERPVTAGWYDDANVVSPVIGDAALRLAVAAADAWMQQATQFAVVRVLSVMGVGASAGGELCVATADEMHGRILGGAADEAIPAVASRALDADEVTVADVSVDASIAARAGITIGRRATLVAAPASLVPRRIWELLRNGRAFVLATPLEPNRGSLAVIDETRADGELANDAAVAAAAQMLRELGVARREVVAGASGRVGLESFATAPRLVLVGRRSLAVLVRDLAQVVGWDVRLVDVPENVRAEIDGLGGRDAVVVLSHAARIDELALVGALRRDGPRFVAALGSRAVAARRRDRLRELGVEQAQIDRLRSPAGLAIGGTTAGAIALSIVAQLHEHQNAPPSQPADRTEHMRA